MRTYLKLCCALAVLGLCLLLICVTPAFANAGGPPSCRFRSATLLPPHGTLAFARR